MAKKSKHSKVKLVKSPQDNIVAENKSTLRIVHHFACSGGTLISKCLAALPNTFLLSEMHPKSTLHMGEGKPKYLPSDVITQARYANIPNIQDLADEVFKSSIDSTYNHVVSLGGELVIRDHTHVDYCVGQSFEKKSYVVDLLKKDYSLARVATIRNPIDSYLSLVKNNWVHFSPQNFDEYCKRFWFFLAEYKEDEIFKYEDFVNSPAQVLEQIAKKLDLSFDNSAIDIFSVFEVTGDSGRSGEFIEPRKRRELDSKYIDEIEKSMYFKKIKNKLNYKL